GCTQCYFHSNAFQHPNLQLKRPCFHETSASDLEGKFPQLQHFHRFRAKDWRNLRNTGPLPRFLERQIRHNQSCPYPGRSLPNQLSKPQASCFSLLISKFPDFTCSTILPCSF